MTIPECIWGLGFRAAAGHGGRRSGDVDMNQHLNKPCTHVSFPETSRPFSVCCRRSWGRCRWRGSAANMNQHPDNSIYTLLFILQAQFICYMLPLCAQIMGPVLVAMRTLNSIQIPVKRPNCSPGAESSPDVTIRRAKPFPSAAADHGAGAGGAAQRRGHEPAPE